MPTELIPQIVYSFDIFDTLIFRMMRKPEDVFARVYKLNSEILSPYFSLNGWIELRKSMEKRAHEKKQEPNIFDIYDEGKKYAFLKNIIECEFSCELECCFLNDDIADEIKKIRNSGYRVVLISDMYWPKEYIFRILSHCGFSIEKDDVFVSCDYACGKIDGKLYDIVLEKCNVSVGNLHHTGDNIISDYVIPLEKGIQTDFYDRMSFAYTYYPFLSMEDIAPTEKSLFSLRVIANEERKEDDYWYTVGTMIYGPFVVGALDFVVDIALKEKINNIFLFMREGDFFCEVIRHIISSRGASIKAEPLYVSRNALRRAQEDEVASINTLNYLKRMGVEEEFVTFDIGYAGTTGKLLDEFLEKNHITTRGIHCLGIQWSTSIDKMLDGHDYRGYIHAEERFESRKIKAWILEMSFMSEKGKTIGYDETGIPILEHVLYSKTQLDAAKKCQEGIRIFVDYYLRLKSHRLNYTVNPVECRNILERYFLYPLIYEVNATSEIEYDEDFYDNFSWKVISDKSVEQFKRKEFDSFEFELNKRPDEWIPGIRCILDPCMSIINRLYHRQEYEEVECIYGLKRFLQEIGEHRFSIVGYGFWGQHVVSYLKAIGVDDKVDVILDNRIGVKNIKIAGRMVISIDQMLQTEEAMFLITVQDVSMCRALRNQILKKEPTASVYYIWK